MRVSSVHSFSVSMLAKGLTGLGFRIAVSKSVIAAVAASTEEVSVGELVWGTTQWFCKCVLLAFQ